MLGGAREGLREFAHIVYPKIENVSVYLRPIYGNAFILDCTQSCAIRVKAKQKPHSSSRITHCNFCPSSLNTDGRTSADPRPRTFVSRLGLFGAPCSQRGVSGYPPAPNGRCLRASPCSAPLPGASEHQRRADLSSFNAYSSLLRGFG